MPIVVAIKTCVCSEGMELTINEKYLEIEWKFLKWILFLGFFINLRFVNVLSTKSSENGCSWKPTEIIGGIVRPLGEAGKLVFRSVKAFFTQDGAAAAIEALKATTKTICSTVTLIPGTGYSFCLACCAGLKLSGMA